jgi:Ala-tRNA(Pro) deacylase
MPLRMLKDYLDSHEIKYVVISHSQAFTAQEIAACAHIPGQEMAKTVMVKLDGKMAMVVLPATRRISFPLLREVTGAHDVELAHEEEFVHVFPGCELGAMPPFGNLYDMDVYVAEPLTHNEMIAFNAGTHTELMRMAYEDFSGLVHPRVAALTMAG